jgi:predicted ribosomally synthesized peptide with nif11-like leader
MTSTSAGAALDRIEADDGLAQRLTEAGGPDGALAVLRAEGFDVTPEEMRDAVLDRYSDQITAEQLDAVAGGADFGDFLVETYGGAVRAMAAAATV